MLRRIPSHSSRWRAKAGWALLVPVILGPACATTPEAPATTPSAPVVPATAVPPPPGDVSPEVEAAWLDLRGGSELQAPADTSAEGRALAGFALLRTGDIAAARTAFEKALEQEPGLAVAAYGLGLAELATGRREAARQRFEAAVESDPELARAAMQLRALRIAEVQGDLTRAESAVRAGDLEGATDAYRAAIAGAPDVAALYVKLAVAEVAREDVEAAIATLETGRRRAGDEPYLLRRLAALYRQRGRYAEASATYGRLADLLPSDEEVQRLADEARREFEEASLPPEYRELPEADSITREELAAILAIHLEGLISAASAEPVIVSDLSDRWSAPFVQRMVGWDVMDVYQNNAFWPEMEVTRSMLVEATYRALEALGLAAEAPRARIEDPPPEHLLYGPVRVVVGLGIMEAAADGSFELLEPVSGSEAIATAERLAAAIRRLQS